MKNRMKKNAALFFVATVFGLLFVSDAYAFRCGDEIVGTGDSRGKVLIKCGKPTHKEKVVVKKSTRTKGQKHDAEDKQVVYDTRPATAKSVEKWSYNCGKDDFIYVLTFEGGVVVKEDTDGRGRGASECLGR
jgi:hypothetical protein